MNSNQDNRSPMQLNQRQDQDQNNRDIMSELGKHGANPKIDVCRVTFRAQQASMNRLSQNNQNLKRKMKSQQQKRPVIANLREDLTAKNSKEDSIDNPIQLLGLQQEGSSL